MLFDFHPEIWNVLNLLLFSGEAAFFLGIIGLFVPTRSVTDNPKQGFLPLLIILAGLISLSLYGDSVAVMAMCFFRPIGFMPFLLMACTTVLFVYCLKFFAKLLKALTADGR